LTYALPLLEPPFDFTHQHIHRLHRTIARHIPDNITFDSAINWDYMISRTAKLATDCLMNLCAIDDNFTP